MGLRMTSQKRQDTTLSGVKNALVTSFMKMITVCFCGGPHGQARTRRTANRHMRVRLLSPSLSSCLDKTNRARTRTAVPTFSLSNLARPASKSNSPSSSTGAPPAPRVRRLSRWFPCPGRAPVPDPAPLPGPGGPLRFALRCCCVRQMLDFRLLPRVHAIFGRQENDMPTAALWGVFIRLSFRGVFYVCTCSGTFLR